MASVLVVFLTITGELYSPLKDLLKDMHYHHWVGKGIWAAVLFTAVTVILYLTTKDDDDFTLTRLVNRLSCTLVCATILLFLFFVYEYSIH